MAVTVTTRSTALDGLRGWAALSVLGYHFYIELGRLLLPFPAMLPLSAIFNGPMAVAIFFVLSGYVLTVGGWGLADKTPVLRQMLKRYPRLVLPILANTLIVLALVLAGLNFAAPAARVLGRTDWLAPWLQFPVGLGDALHYALVRVFELAPDDQYNPFLWTMFIELWMAWLVLLVSLGENRLGRRATYGILAVLFVVGTLLSFGIGCFIAGALLALLRRDSRLSFQLDALPAIGILVACLTAAGTLRAFAGPQWPLALLAPVVLLVALRSPAIERLLQTPLSATLGRLSFPLYLMQFPVLISATSWMIVTAGSGLNLALVALIGSVSIALTFACATAFLPVEWLALRAGREVAKLLPPRRTTAAAPRVSPS